MKSYIAPLILVSAFAGLAVFGFAQVNDRASEPKEIVVKTKDAAAAQRLIAILKKKEIDPKSYRISGGVKGEKRTELGSLPIKSLKETTSRLFKTPGETNESWEISISVSNYTISIGSSKVLDEKDVRSAFKNVDAKLFEIKSGPAMSH